MNSAHKHPLLPLRNKSDFFNRVKRQTSTKDIKATVRNYSKLDENKDTKFKAATPLSKDMHPIQNNFMDEVKKPRQRYSILSATNSILEDARPRVHTSLPAKRITMRFSTHIEKVPLETLKKLFKSRCADLNIPYLEKQQNRFLEYCTKSIKPYKLVMNECGFGIKSSYVIAEIIKMDTEFRYIELVNNNFADDGLKVISDALMLNHKIISINVALCSVTSEGSDIFLEKIAKHPTIIEINLSNNEGLRKNKISGKGCHKVKELLIKNSVINYLNIADNSIGHEGLKLLAQGLEKATSLISLNISNNNLPNNAFTYITEGLMKCGLKELILRKNELGDKCVNDILDVIYKRSFPIEVLDISLNQITSNAANMLFQALKNNKCIAKLNLSQNNLAHPLTQIGSCLRSNKKLKYLYMSECELNEENGVFIAEGVAFNDTLMSLVLDGNKLCDSAVSSIGQALKTNKSLKVIDLSSNNFGDEGCMGIIEGLKSNNTVESLQMKNNKIGNKTACLLMHCVVANDQLLHVNTQLNLFNYKYTEGIEEKIKKNRETKKKQMAPRIRSEFNLLKENVDTSKQQPYNKLMLVHEKKNQKQVLKQNQSLFDNIIAKENQNLKDIYDEMELITQRNKDIKKELKDIDYEMDDIDAQMTRGFDEKQRVLNRVLDQNALLSREAEKEREKVHTYELTQKYTLAEIEEIYTRLMSKLENTELLVEGKQKLIDELKNELNPKPIVTPVEIVKTEKKNKKKKKLKRKQKKCMPGYTPKISIGKENIM